jgi:2-phospho-L-lactate transferase/gluconeogenesis factor (CofD/UPF0052 family)
MSASLLSPSGLPRTQDAIEGEVEDDVFAVPVEEIKHINLRRPTLTSRPDSKGMDLGLGPTVVISGGSGYNDLVGATPGATFVMPVSDNGGSSSEIIRVLGGPSIGDLRSRLVRMIPLSSDEDRSAPASNDALHALLSYRLPSKGRPREIKQEWMDILEGRHRLWRGIEAERKECVRGFLVYFESEILRRAHRNFNFRGGSIGNFFLAAAQKFFRSIQSAIFLFSATTLINTTQAGRVLPVINTNHTATIAASLENGQVILGQCEISHPSRPREQRDDSLLSSGMDTPASAIFDPFQSTSLLSRLTVGSLGDGLEPDPENDIDEDGSSVADDDEELELNENTTHKVRSRIGNIVFSKDSEIPDNLPARIERLFYVNAYGNEVQPAPNPEYISSLYSSRTLLYSCGSLWTSIVPCLALRGVAAAITTSQSLRYKILLLNTTTDRETSSLTGLDFVHVITRSMAQSDSMETLPVHKAVTHIIYSPEGQIPVDIAAMSRLGIECIAVHLSRNNPRFDEEQVRVALDRITASEM